MKKIKFFTLLLALLSASTPRLFAQDAIAQNKASIMAAYDALNRRDWPAFAALCAPEFTDLNVGPAPAVGVNAAIELYKQFHTSFPDFKISIQEIAPVNPSRFLIRVTVTGTNTGSFMGLPPTGKSIKFEDSDIVAFNAQGKAISHSITNNGEPLVQIGYGSMLNPSTQAVIAVYEKFGKGDVAGILDNSTEDVLFDIQDRMFDSKARQFKGKAEVGQFFQELGSKFQYTRFQPIRFVADGDDVFVLIDAEYKLLANGKTYSSQYTHHFKVQNGKIAFFRGLDDFQKM